MAAVRSRDVDADHVGLRRDVGHRFVRRSGDGGGDFGKGLLCHLYPCHADSTRGVFKLCQAVCFALGQIESKR